MITSYKDAGNALEGGDPYIAAQKFLEAELYFLNHYGHLDHFDSIFILFTKLLC